MNKDMENFKGKPEKILSFKEHSKTDNEILNEGAIWKKPSVLFALLWRTYSKVKGANDEDKRAKYQAQMTWISGQMTFSYIKSLEDKIDSLSKDIKRLKVWVKNKKDQTE